MCIRDRNINESLKNINRVNSSLEGENSPKIKKDLQEVMQMSFGVFRSEENIKQGIEEITRSIFIGV